MGYLDGNCHAHFAGATLVPAPRSLGCRPGWWIPSAEVWREIMIYVVTRRAPTVLVTTWWFARGTQVTQCVHTPVAGICAWVLKSLADAGLATARSRVPASSSPSERAPGDQWPGLPVQTGGPVLADASARVVLPGERSAGPAARQLLGTPRCNARRRPHTLRQPGEDAHGLPGWCACWSGSPPAGGRWRHRGMRRKQPAGRPLAGLVKTAAGRRSGLRFSAHHAAECRAFTGLLE